MSFLLSLAILFPTISLLLGFAVNKDSIRAYGIVVTIIEFLITIWIWLSFDFSNSNIQLIEFIPLIKTLGISYYVGVDGISIFLVILTSFIVMICMFCLSVKKSVKNIILSILFLETTMIGLFLSLDAILFYVFWEISVIPMIYIIGSWGGKNRVYASIKFFLYTILGSILMLVGILYMAYLYNKATGIWSFSITDWQSFAIPFNTQIWLFLAFFIAFAIKIPMFPFHTWLPYAHGQAPTVGSVILAAILLKMGAYGFIRISIPMFPQASLYFAIPIAILCVIMVIYTSMIAYAQKDLKQVIAYSSIAHMGIVVLGIFSLTIEGISGAIFLMISHGLVSGGLFILVGVIHDRTYTKDMSCFGGIAKNMPAYATIFAIVLMASVGLPLTIGFVGEFLSLLGFYKVSAIITFLAGLGIILSSLYMLRAYRKVFLGKITNEKNKFLKDLNIKERFALVPIVVLIILFGVYPKPLLEPINKSVGYVMNNIFDNKIQNSNYLKDLDFQYFLRVNT